MDKRNMYEFDKKINEQLFDNARDILLIISEESGKILKPNNAAVRAYGYSHDELIGGSLPNLEMRTAQVGLLFLGYTPGKIDGIIGPRTRAAIKNFRIAAGLAASEELDGPTYRVLCKKAGIRP